MTKRMTTAELAAVMADSLAGRETERRPVDGEGEWRFHDPEMHGWDSGRWIYRLKPKPRQAREWWLNVYPRKNARRPGGYVYGTQDEAERYSVSDETSEVAVHVQELLPEEE